MANEALVSAVKVIVGNARAGKLDEAYAGYKALFASPDFRKYEIAERRQALRLMIHAKEIRAADLDPVRPSDVDGDRRGLLRGARAGVANRDDRVIELCRLHPRAGRRYARRFHPRALPGSGLRDDLSTPRRLRPQDPFGPGRGLGSGSR